MYELLCSEAEARRRSISQPEGLLWSLVCFLSGVQRSLEERTAENYEGKVRRFSFACFVFLTPALTSAIISHNNLVCCAGSLA